MLTGYNTSIHSTIGMPPTKVNPSNIYIVRQSMNSLWAKIPQGRVKFKVGDLVRIRKENVKYAKGYELKFQQRYLGSPRLYSAGHNLFTS